MNRRVGGLATLLMTMAVVAGCGGADSKDKGSDSAPTTAPAPTETATEATTFTVSGILILDGVGTTDPDGTNCKDTVGTTEIAQGTELIVLSGAGEKIALGNLESGTPRGKLSKDIGSGFRNSLDGCDFRFVIDGVPDSGNVYSLRVGDIKGVVDFTKDDASNLQLTLQGTLAGMVDAP